MLFFAYISHDFVYANDQLSLKRIAAFSQRFIKGSRYALADDTDDDANDL